MIESDYAKCEFVEKDNVVFHTWKKEAHFDNYRKPVEASLKMLREHGLTQKDLSELIGVLFLQGYNGICFP